MLRIVGVFLVATGLWAPTLSMAQEPAPEDDSTAENDGADPSIESTEESGSDALPAEVRPAGTSDGPPNRANDGPRREVPNYDGREDYTTAGEVLLWIPRILVSPLYLVTEFVIRRPLGFMVTGLEEEEIPQKIFSAFTFGPNNESLLVPTAFLDFGFRPSFGAFFRTQDFLFPGHIVSAAASFGGPSWTNFQVGTGVADPSDDNEWEIQLSGRWLRRPDGRFFGLGQELNDDADSRYAFTVLATELGADWFFSEGSRLSGHAGIRNVEFNTDSCCDPDLTERVAAGVFSQTPPGYDEGYTAARFNVEATYDTRPPRTETQKLPGLVPQPGTGLRFSGGIEYAFDLNDPSERSWARYSASVGGFVDLTGYQQSIGLTVWTQYADAIDGEVPFTEQVDLGGAGAPAVRLDGHRGPLIGFTSGRLIGDSALAAIFEYRWPIWVFLDGSVHVAMGNVFDGYLDDFDLERFRVSFGFGFRTIGERGNSLDVMIGFGTEPLEDGGSVESFRLVFGTSPSF